MIFKKLPPGFHAGTAANYFSARGCAGNGGEVTANNPQHNFHPVYRIQAPSEATNDDDQLYNFSSNSCSGGPGPDPSSFGNAGVDMVADAVPAVALLPGNSGSSPTL